jgi:hypothetical protein
MIGTMLSGITLTVDKNGKIRGSDGKFIGFWRQIGFLIIDMVISALLVTFASSMLRNILWENREYMLAIVSGAFIIFIFGSVTHLAIKQKNIGKLLPFLY